MWKHTWLLVCHSLLGAGDGLAGGLDSKGPRTSSTGEIMRLKQNKVRMTKGIVRCCSVSLQQETCGAFVSSFKLEQANRKRKKTTTLKH